MIPRYYNLLIVLIAVLSSLHGVTALAEAKRIKKINLKIPPGDYRVQCVEPDHPAYEKYVGWESPVKAYARSIKRAATRRSHYATGAGVVALAYACHWLATKSWVGAQKFAEKGMGTVAMGLIITLATVVFSSEYTTIVITNEPKTVWRVSDSPSGQLNSFTMSPVLDTKRVGLFLKKRKVENVVFQKGSLVARNATLDVFDSDDSEEEDLSDRYIIYIAKPGIGRVVKYLRADYWNQVSYSNDVKTAFELIPVKN